MLLFICSVIDHRCHQNVGKKEKEKKNSDTQDAAELSMMLLPSFDTFCDLLLNSNMTEWNLIHFFTMIK